jgi:hypothetical protein
MSTDLPTDLKLLNEIYRTNLRAFSDYSEDNKTRSAKIWMPIELDALAKQFNTDPDMIFGRLYYHLNAKFRMTLGENEHVDFFQPRIGKDRYCVNFPYLASVLADLREEHRRFLIATGIAVLSLVISIASIGIAIFV